MDTATKALKNREIKAVPAANLLPDSKKPAIGDGGLFDIPKDGAVRAQPWWSTAEQTSSARSDRRSDSKPQWRRR